MRMKRRMMGTRTRRKMMTMTIMTKIMMMTVRTMTMTKTMMMKRTMRRSYFYLHNIFRILLQPNPLEILMRKVLFKY